MHSTLGLAMELKNSKKVVTACMVFQIPLNLQQLSTQYKILVLLFNIIEFYCYSSLPWKTLLDMLVIVLLNEAIWASVYFSLLFFLKSVTSGVWLNQVESCCCYSLQNISLEWSVYLIRRLIWFPAIWILVSLPLRLINKAN